LEDWQAGCASFRNAFRDDVMGRFSNVAAPLNPRSRELREQPKWKGYEIALDVYTNVFAWGYLLVPKDIKAGERRPVVVCQHGLEGVPEDVITADQKSQGYHF